MPIAISPIDLSTIIPTYIIALLMECVTFIPEGKIQKLQLI